MTYPHAQAGLAGYFVFYFLVFKAIRVRYSGQLEHATPFGCCCRRWWILFYQLLRLTSRTEMAAPAGNYNPLDRGFAAFAGLGGS